MSFSINERGGNTVVPAVPLPLSIPLGSKRRRGALNRPSRYALGHYFKKVHLRYYPLKKKVIEIRSSNLKFAW